LDKSIITSSTSLFALIISPFSSVLADSLGRNRVILFADALFILGALVQAMSSTVTIMVVGRCIVGAGVGAASFVVPLYIAEIAPAAYRGRLITTNVLFITFGQVVAYIIGWCFAEYGSQETGWRWMVGLGAVPAVVQGALVMFMPETPRWLVKMGLSAQARAIVIKVSGNSPRTMRHADSVVNEIELELKEEQIARRLRASSDDERFQWLGVWQELLTVGRNRRALAIACLLQGLQQLCGFVSSQADGSISP
jgi:SP family myo-inositol transporter-like MFS transporter 13